MSGSGGNRQDNRQRGNAAQLLEKYKSMARDAQLGGDRVQSEYFLQFADHYFRVLSESRSRFDDQRRGREDEDGAGDEDDASDLVDGDGDGDTEAEARERPRRRPVQARDRDERPERGERHGRGNGRVRDSRSNEQPDERIPFDVLPPAIGAEDSKAEAAADSEDDSPRPRRRTRRPRADDGESEVAPAA